MQPVTAFSDYYGDLALIAPEIVLSVGAMILLMIGVFRGAASSSAVTGLAIALLIIAGICLYWLAPV